MRTRRTHGRRPWYGVALLAGLVVGLVIGALVLQTPRLSLEAAEYVAAVADLYAREGNLDQARAWLAEARLTSRRDLQALRIALATAHPERTESLRALDALIEALQRSEGVPLWQRALPILAGLAWPVGPASRPGAGGGRTASSPGSGGGSHCDDPPPGSGAPVGLPASICGGDPAGAPPGGRAAGRAGLGVRLPGGRGGL